MNPDALQNLVKKCLEDFYKRRVGNLSNLQLKQVLKRKNPYLLRAIGLRTAAELVEFLLQMHTQASDETIFGETFVEPIALAISGGHKSSAKGIDLEPEFYLELVRLMQNYPEQQKQAYQQEWAKAVNRFTRDLLNEFASAEGELDWEKIVRFNSGA